MNNYVLVMKGRRGLKIGLKRYNKIDATKRVEELKAIGIFMKAMTEQEAFGTN